MTYVYLLAFASAPVAQSARNQICIQAKERCSSTNRLCEGTLCTPSAFVVNTKRTHVCHFYCEHWSNISCLVYFYTKLSSNLSFSPSLRTSLCDDRSAEVWTLLRGRWGGCSTALCDREKYCDDPDILYENCQLSGIRTYLKKKWRISEYQEPIAPPLGLWGVNEGIIHNRG